MLNKFWIFLLLIAIAIPKAHALVVAPFIVVGIVQLLVWLVGVITIPITLCVKLISKASIKKVLLISFLIIAAICGIFYAYWTLAVTPNKIQGKRVTQNYIQKQDAGAPLLAEDRMPVDPESLRTKPIASDADPFPPIYSPPYIQTPGQIMAMWLKTALTVSIALFIPALIGVIAVNFKNKKLSNIEIVLWAGTISNILAIITVFFIALLG